MEGRASQLTQEAAISLVAAQAGAGTWVSLSQMA